MRTRSRLRTWLLAVVLFAGGAGLAAQPARPPAQTDGFVPVESLGVQEQLPAAPLVMAAYAVAWVVVFGYLWSIWRRLGNVERDIVEIRRRVEGAPRR